MKTIIFLTTCALILSLTQEYHHKIRHLKSKHTYSLRLKSKVSLKYLNLHGLYKYNRLSPQYQLNDQNAADLYSTCVEGLEGAQRLAAVEKFKDIAITVAKVLKQQVSTAIQDSYWLYYVANEGKCDFSSEQLGIQFMAMPKGDPRQHDFSDPNNRIGFLKVCLNRDGKNKGGQIESDKDSNEAKGAYLLLNCAFDSCATAKWQDNQEVQMEDRKVKGNCAREVDQEESITIQNSQDKNSLKVVGDETVNSLGRFIS